MRDIELFLPRQHTDCDMLRRVTFLLFKAVPSGKFVHAFVLFASGMQNS